MNNCISTCIMDGLNRCIFKVQVIHIFMREVINPLALSGTI